MSKRFCGQNISRHVRCEDGRQDTERDANVEWTSIKLEDGSGEMGLRCRVAGQSNYVIIFRVLVLDGGQRDIIWKDNSEWMVMETRIG